MVEEVIHTNSLSIVLKYDKKKYNIEYAKNKNIIILRRLSDNKIIEVFNDKIGFIVQCNTGEQVNFLISDYSRYDENHEVKFKHYTDDGYSDSLHLEEVFNCQSAALSNIRITDSSYIVGIFGDISYIYNLKQISKRFSKIYNDKKVKEFFKDNTLLVSEEIYVRSDVRDILTYGINPETLEIATPIWSELQQRYITVYTQEQVDKLRKELYKKGVFLNGKNLDEITIDFEVKRYLIEIAKQFDGPQSVYTDILEHEVNEKFVKKFVKN